MVSMMAGGPNRTLKLSYVGDSSKLNKANAEAESGLSKLGAGFKKFGKIAAVGALAAGAAFVAVGKKLFDAAEAASTANARIETIAGSMGLFGDQAGAVSGRLVKLAEDQARLTGVSRETIKETSALLLTFKGVASSADEVGGTFDRAQTAALDLAAAGFGSATGNAQALGKALEDPTRGLTALTRSGVTFTAEEKERIRVLQESNRLGEAQAIILDAIEQQVGGTAAATANASDRIRETFGVLTDQIALSLAPTFEKLTDGVFKLIERFQEFWTVHGPAIVEAFQRAQERAAETAATVREKLEPIIKRLFDRAVELVGAFRDWWRNVGPGVLDSFRRLKDPIVELWTNIREAWTNVKELIGNFRTGESDGKGFERFIDRLVSVFEFLLNVINLVITAVNRMLDVFRRVTESKAFQALLSGIGSIAGAVGGGISKLRGITGLASGGIVTRPTLAMVGEGGEPEAVIPLSKMGQMGGGVNITINGAIDPEATARQIRRILEDSERRTGARLNYAA
jgi:hypothetical protein